MNRNIKIGIVLGILIVASVFVAMAAPSGVGDGGAGGGSPKILNPTQVQKELDAKNQKNQTVDQSSSTESSILATSNPPWDSRSPNQQSNTKNYMLKVDYIPQTEWTDIQGSYAQQNYFDLPISVKLVNSANSPIGSQKIYVWIYEYKDNGFGSYQYITSYSNTKSTDSAGNADFIYSFPYRGYFKSMYKVYVYWTGGNSEFKQIIYNVHTAWYIN